MAIVLWLRLSATSQSNSFETERLVQNKVVLKLLQWFAQVQVLLVSAYISDITSEVNSKRRYDLREHPHHHNAQICEIMVFGEETRVAILVCSVVEIL